MLWWDIPPSWSGAPHNIIQETLTNPLLRHLSQSPGPCNYGTISCLIFTFQGNCWLAEKRLNRTKCSTIPVLQINPSLKLLKATEESSISSQYKHTFVAGRGLICHTPTPDSLLLSQKRSSESGDICVSSFSPIAGPLGPDLEAAESSGHKWSY